MKKQMLLRVPARNGDEFGFVVLEDPAHLAEWRAAGLDIYPIEYQIPAWVAGAGLARAYALAVDVWRFLWR